MEEGYDRKTMVGVLGTEPILTGSLFDGEEEISREIAGFLLFVRELNGGKIG